MSTERSMLIAFILNFSFSIIEFIGGSLTNSVAIISDAVHDIGDAISIGISFFLEKKSKKQPDNIYTFGYARYSVIGSVITTLILLFGSVMVIYNSIQRIFHPVSIDYNRMIIFALFGVIVNFIAAYITRKGDSINQKAVNLHMLEDVLGWAVVLVGAVVMRFTDIGIIDPIMSILVSLYILFFAIKNLKEALDLFLEKTPDNVSVEKIREHLNDIDGVIDTHHIHLWSTDGRQIYATMHIVTDDNSQLVKEKVRNELKEHGISHITLELEGTDEVCLENNCCIDYESLKDSNHHHHHHH